MLYRGAAFLAQAASPYKYSMARNNTRFESSQSSTRVNGNYSVNITFDHNSRGTVELRGRQQTAAPFGDAHNIKYTVPNRVASHRKPTNS